MKKDQETSNWTWIIIGGILVFLVLVLFIPNSNNKTSSEEIKISGVGEILTITNQDNLDVYISGTDHQIYFSKESNPQQISLSGVGNTVYLCSQIHNPVISKSGVDNSINYINC